MINEAVGDPVFAHALCLIEQLIHIMHGVFQIRIACAGDKPAADRDPQSGNVFPGV